MALLFLAVATILVSPMLLRLSSGYAIDQRVERGLCEQYAADAATEYGVRSITADEALHEQLVGNIGVLQELDLPATVNNISPTLQVVCIEAWQPAQEWTWAIWAMSEIYIEKNNTVIWGGLYCNGLINIEGNGTVIHGGVQCDVLVEDPSTVISGTVEVPTGYQPFPVSWEIADFISDSIAITGTYAYSATQEGMYYVHEEPNWSFSLGGDLAPGLHYFTGNVVIDDNGVNGENVTVVAEGTITFSKNQGDYVSPYVPDLLFFSNSDSAQAILIDGNKFSAAGGVLFAPNGTIEVAGNNTTIEGASFVADRVAITKNDLIIQVPGELSVPISMTHSCGIFDVRAVAGDAIITARISACGDDTQVLSWYVH